MPQDPEEDGGIGFEDGQLNDGGFAAMGFDTQGGANNLIRNTGNNLFQKFSSGRGAAALTQKDEIKLDLMKIQKKIDVKKLKHQLWTYINPKIEGTLGMKESTLSRPTGARPAPEDDLEMEQESLKMSEVLGSLYQSNEIDSDNVSIHSAFICLLHIANEKGLALVSEPGTTPGAQESELKIYKAVRT